MDYKVDIFLTATALRAFIEKLPLGIRVVSVCCSDGPDGHEIIVVTSGHGYGAKNKETSE